MLRRTIASYVALVLGATTCAYAQNELRGVNKMRVEVGDLDDDAKQCGLTREAIERRLVQAVQFDTDIQFVKGPRLPLLRADVPVMRTRGLCVAHVLIQVVMTDSFDFSLGDKRMGTIELFKAGAIATTEKTDGSGILGTVAHLGHTLAQQWDEDNP